MSITTTELAKESPFGINVRFAEDVNGKTWFFLVSTVGISTRGEPLIIGGKGPRRNNYRVVPATMYSNYRGLATWQPGLGDVPDDFSRAMAMYGEKAPVPHLLEIDGALLLRYSISQVAQWLDNRLKTYARHGELGDDDEAREWAKKYGPFITITDDELADLDGALPPRGDQDVPASGGAAQEGTP